MGSEIVIPNLCVEKWTSSTQNYESLEYTFLVSLNQK